MRKFLFLACFAMLVVATSCMKDEVVATNRGEAIGFRTAVDTRGLEVERTSLQSFYVTALETGAEESYFEDVMFLLVGYDGYSSTPEYYWPGDDRRLEFYAYAPSVEEMGNATVTINHNEKSIKGFVVDEDIITQKDLVFAYNNGEGEGLEAQADVPLTFSHKLSMIEVQARTSSDYIYEIAGVRLGGVYNKGDLADIRTNDWVVANDATKPVYSMSHEEEDIVVVDKYGTQRLLGTLPNLNDYEDYNYIFMLPQDITPWDPENDPTNENGGAYLSVNVRITTTDGVRVFPETDGFGWVAIPLSVDANAGVSAGKWLGGYRYSYTLDFTNGAGYGDPDEDNSGEVVLGDAVIKLKASLSEMDEGVENLVVNPNMIGEWKAYHFWIDCTYYTLDDAGERVVIETVREIESEDIDVIGAQIDNFADISILDGKKLWIKDPRTGQRAAVDYLVNDDNYILIDCYRDDSAEVGSLDESDYSPAPHIEEIIPASESQQGNATITNSYNGYEYRGNDRIEYEEVMTIKYTIDIVGSN